MANRVLLGNVKGETGATGPAGATGASGANGLTPYIQNGTWWLGVQDTGVTAEGNKWFANNYDPSGEGNNGDLYLNTLTGDVFQKINNVWNIVANIKGQKGDTGEKGEKGETAISVRVGNVITGEAGTKAFVENVGTDKDLILDFTIPKGEKGDKGETGEDGQDGGSQHITETDTSLNINIEQDTGTSLDTGSVRVLPQQINITSLKNSEAGQFDAGLGIFGEGRIRMGVDGPTESTNFVLKPDEAYIATTNIRMYGESFTYNDEKINIAHGSPVCTLPASVWGEDKQLGFVFVETDFFLDPQKRNEIDVLPESVEEWARCGVIAISEQLNDITFKCKKIPTTDLYFRVVSTEVNYVSK